MEDQVRFLAGSDVEGQVRFLAGSDVEDQVRFFAGSDLGRPVSRSKLPPLSPSLAVYHGQGWGGCHSGSLATQG